MTADGAQCGVCLNRLAYCSAVFLYRGVVCQHKCAYSPIVFNRDGNEIMTIRTTKSGMPIAQGVVTHEDYVQAVAAIVIANLEPADRDKLSGIKLAYGAGAQGLRGITYYDAWDNVDHKAPFVELCAFGQESIVQLAGTTIHELGHVLAGFAAGHSNEWKAACGKLGLRRIKAAGTQYCWSMFDPAIRAAINALPTPSEGAPVVSFRGAGNGGSSFKPKPCTQGIGTRGGTSRGVGSGSRLRKFVCECEPPIIIRAGRDVLPVTCDCCAAGFHLSV